MKLVFATRNRGKISEARRILQPFGVQLLSLDDCGLEPSFELSEPGETFEENALGKARQLQRLLGGWVLADDSGLEVDALGGAPGVYSARYAGVAERGQARDLENLRRVLDELADVPPRRRSARFVCVMALVGPGGRELVCRGVCQGRIATAARGENGFGYDPIFLPRRYRRTMAELSAEEKNAISHRGRALRALARRLPKFFVSFSSPKAAAHRRRKRQPLAATVAAQKTEKVASHDRGGIQTGR